MATSKAPANTHYDLLGLAPSASVQDIRRAYRDRSKIYHPDTTKLPPEIAKAKFHELNEAYATLSNPERRLQYDQKIGYSRIPVIQVRSDLNRPINRDRNQPFRSTKDYLDPTDRPLSAGEIFALFLLGVTFIACLVLVVMIGLTKGESALQAYPAQVPLGFLRPHHEPSDPTAPSLLDPASERIEVQTQSSLPPDTSSDLVPVRQSQPLSVSTGAPDISQHQQQVPISPSPQRLSSDQSLSDRSGEDKTAEALPEVKSPTTDHLGDDAT